MGEIYTCRVRDLTIQIDLDAGEEREGIRNNELWRATTYDEKEPDTLDWLDRFLKGILLEILRLTLHGRY